MLNGKLPTGNDGRTVHPSMAGRGAPEYGLGGPGGYSPGAGSRRTSDAVGLRLPATPAGLRPRGCGNLLIGDQLPPRIRRSPAVWARPARRTSRQIDPIRGDVHLPVAGKVAALPVSVEHPVVIREHRQIEHIHLSITIGVGRHSEAKVDVLYVLALRNVSPPFPTLRRGLGPTSGRNDANGVRAPNTHADSPLPGRIRKRVRLATRAQLKQVPD